MYAMYWRTVIFSGTEGHEKKTVSFVHMYRVYVLQVKFDLRLILILPRLILNFLCPLALVDRGNQEST